MSIGPYKKKRSLDQSGEPKGKTERKKKERLTFVVQRHAARKLHYDLRLEMEGVLKSWAIPKGPSLDPDVKRLAIHVEDHPLEYGEFEGTIPKGNYGAGKVAIWDKGFYTSSDSAKRSLTEQLHRGELKIVLHGERLRGEFVLVKLKDDSDKDQWLLIKKKDDFSQEGHNAEDETLDDKQQALILSGKKLKMPHHIAPMLATTVKDPFDHKDWIFEIKWDGYRAVAEITSKGALLYSRNFHSFNDRFPTLVKQLGMFKTQLILDGEIVALKEDGKADFQLLQQYLKSGEGEDALRYFVFDLLYCEGRDIRDLPLVERKVLLKEIMENQTASQVTYSDHIEERGIAFFEEVKKEKMEGIIAKHKQSAYLSKRSKDWVKIKSRLTEEVVVGGFTAPKKGRNKFGSLLLGIYKNNKLTFVGHVGGGFDEKLLEEIFDRLQPLITAKCPFSKVPRTNAPATWVKPELVCELEFQEWTKDNIMRQPIFKRLRGDKDPHEVRKQEPIKKSELLKKQDGSNKNSFISNREKIYWPKEKYTKGDLLDYYESISSYLLPYLKGRPQVLHRFPDGIKGKDFYQKEAPEFTPEWMQTASIEHTDRVIKYLMIENLNSLLYVVNLGCIELHPFNSRTSKIDYPDYLVLDLDPEAIAFKYVVETAKVLHEILESIGLPHYCKTSGKRGLHLFVPLGAKYTFDQAGDFAQLLARLGHKELPSITSLTRDPKKRQNRVYIDYLQNSRTKTIVAPFSVRPASKATVSTPLEWEEVKKGLDPAQFTMLNVLDRLKNVEDPLKPMLEQEIDLSSAIEIIEKSLS
jgi:bifunctional non-homologous end joining protein LigD